MKTLQRWSVSPANKLTLGNYLPEYNVPVGHKQIASEVALRKNDALEIISISKEEFGHDSLTCKMYLDSIGHKYAEVDFLARAEKLKRTSDLIDSGVLDINSQDAVRKQEIIDDIHRLRRLGEDLFGVVDPERFGAIVARATHAAKAILRSPNSSIDVADAAVRLLTTLPDADPSLADKHIYKPSEELLDAWRPYVKKKYRSLISIPDPQQNHFETDDIVMNFQKAIMTISEEWSLTSASEWVVKIGKTNINVDMEGKTIWVPKKRTVDLETMRGLLVHETGGHLLRNLLGEASGDAFLATDMPGRGSDEEALLVALEQVLSGKSRETGINYYLMIGLAHADDPIPLPRLEQTLLDYLTVMKGRELTPCEIESACKQAFRVTRGMPSITIDGQVYQSAYSADIKYAIGQKNAIAFLEENRANPSALDTVMYGKFAYSRKYQLSYTLQKQRSNLELFSRVPSAA